MKPYHMNLETFEKYKAFGEPIGNGSLEKLTHLEEPLLQPLINRILEIGLVIEQEAYL